MKNNFPKVSIITVNFNGKKYLKKFFGSVFCLDYPKDKLEVILIDNVSTDNSIKFVKKNYPKVKIIKNDVNNYCKAINLGIKASKAKFVALVNNDTKLDRNWLIELIKVIYKDKNIAVVGSKILNMAGKIQNAAHYELPNFYWGERGAGREIRKYDAIEEVPSLCGAAVLYRRALLLEVGLFDEDFVIYGEDVDMSLRLRQKGYKLIFVPASIVYHVFHGSASEEFARYYIERNRLLFLAKHYPYKLSSALLGSGYFTAKKSIHSCGKIYSIFPEIIMKLIRTHSWNIANEVITELFGEISKIVNYENDLLVQEINNFAMDRNRAYELKSQALQELQQKIENLALKDKEILNKDSHLLEKDAQINQLQQEIQRYLNTIQDKENLLKEQKRELAGYKDELTNLSNQLKSRIDELLLKDSRLMEKDTQTNQLQQEIQTHLSLLRNKENILQEREKELASYKDELNNLSGQLKLKIHEVILKDSHLLKKDNQINALDTQINQLQQEIQGHLNTIQDKENLLQEKERELLAYKDELANLSGQLRSRMDEVLLKDGQLSEKDNQINKLNEELNTISQQLKSRIDELLLKDGQLIEKKVEVDALRGELSSLAEQSADNLVTIEEIKTQLSEKEKELSAYKDELNNLSTQLGSRMDEVLIKDGQIIEKDTQLSSLNAELENLTNQLQQEIQRHINIIQDRENLLQDKENLLQEKERELSAYKDELANISGQLHSRMDEVLIKDGELIEKNTQLSSLKSELDNLTNQLQQKTDDIILKEKELASYKDELNNLSTQLRQRMDEVLLKDAQLVEKENNINALTTQISQLKQEIQDYVALLREKENLISLREGETVSLRNELNGIYNSEGFRFVLRPLWTLIWNTRGFLKITKRKSGHFFWFIISFVLTPIFVLLSLSFLFEYIAWIILKPLLRIITPKRKTITFPDIKDEKISIVIPNYNGVEFLKECLLSIFATTEFQDGQNEVLVVDDGSKDGSVNFIKRNFAQIRLIQNRKNRGFGFTCNRGVKCAKNEIVVLINNDIIFTRDFLKPLIKHLQREDVFATTPKLYAWDRKTFVWGMHMGYFKEGYIRLWNEAEMNNGDRINQASPSIFAIGGAMVFRKQDYLWLGGFDEIYRPNCWEDIDISYRAWKRGLKVIYEPSSLMYHKGRATLSYERPKEIKNELLFTWKNITDTQILKSHLNLLPWNLYRNRAAFFKGFFWALNYLPQTLVHRLLERRFIFECEDKKIFNKITLYYKNFMKREFKHSSGEKHNILIISRFFPYPLKSGGKIRIHNLVKLLSEKYNFILLSLIDHEDELKYTPKLKEVFTEVYPILAKSSLSLDFYSELFYPNLYKFAYSYSQELVDKFKELQEAKPIDIIHIESNELLYLTPHIKHTPIVYTEHDISILSFGKSYYKSNGHFIASFFDHLKRIYFHNTQFKKLDKIITLSKEDEYVLKRFFPKSDITLVPTGVDLKHFSHQDNHRKSKKLIFVGHYPHYPNEDAIVYFAKKIFPLIRKRIPDAELLIVGSSPTPNVKVLAQEQNVVLVGEVDDVKPYLADADVFVNSLRISAGIKGKVLEAISCGVPVVSTKVGSSGIDAQPEKEILIANSPREFARQVIRLLNDDALRRRLTTNARRLVENKYDWHKCADKLDIVYSSLLFDAEYENPNFSITEEILNNTKNFIEHKIEQLDGDLANPESGPEELHIELTYNCNSKCIMCDLWDYNKRLPKLAQKELSLDEIKHFVEESRLLQKSKVVVLSGGEPFLRNDIVNLCGFFSKQLTDSSIGILTNGVDTETIVTKTKEVLDKFQPKALWLGSSLDGIGREHDKIRGSEGAFLALCETINRCKRELPNVKLSVTFTLTPYNIDQLVPARQFADNEGLDFFAQFVVPKEARGEFIWRPEDLKLAEKEIMQIIQGIIGKTDKQTLLNSIDKIKDKNLISNLYYWSHLVKYQTNPQRFFKKCVSGSKFAMFNPYGDLFFCPIHKGSLIGNVREERFDNLWMSERAQYMRSFIKDSNCHCWLVCIVFPVLEKVLHN